MNVSHLRGVAADLENRSIELQNARRLLHRLTERLRDGTATSAEHRPALEAILLLPEPEAVRWLHQVTRRFAVVYQHERDQHRTTTQPDHHRRDTASTEPEPI